MSEFIAHVNGKLVPAGESCVSIDDRGFLRGDGIYETIRVRHGRCVRMDSHLRRLGEGIALLRLPVDQIDYEGAIDQLLRANGLSDARVRITLTRGAGRDATVVMTAEPLEEWHPQPTALAVSRYGRDPTSPLCRIKSTNCLASTLSSIEAAERGFDDALLLNTFGRAAECTSANIFVVSGASLVTPSADEGCLPGTVREEVLRRAPEFGLVPLERHVTPADLAAADEVFLTSAIQLLRPAARIEETVLRVGTLWRKMGEALIAAEEQPAPS